MQGRDYVAYARGLLGGGTEVSWRTAAGRAYYGLMLECREALSRWGFPLPPHENVHSFVRLRFVYPADADLKKIGAILETLNRLRNEADYRLSSTWFATDARARLAVVDATTALALLDAIVSDPVRAAAAVAAIRAAFP